MKIRLYGPSIGNGSFARVASGMRGALEGLELFAGFVPIDAIDEDVSYPGHDADIGVYVGPFGCACVLKHTGWHKERYAMLAPNSTWLPYDMLAKHHEMGIGFLTPSRWGRDVIDQNLPEADVEIWQHGVADGFARNEADLIEARRAYEAGHFTVAHLASTTNQRKGTRELLEAWAQGVRAGVLGKRPVLRLVVDGPEDAFRVPADVANTVVFQAARMNMSIERTARFYRAHHVVCQPSRGEGFGMVPLEALACGVPVVATGCTGHAEFMDAGTMGGIVIPTGVNEPIDDGPDGTAPAIRVDDVLDNLVTTYSLWPMVAEQAFGHAADVQTTWSWRAVTERWLADRS